jgi:DNA repair exonuclease SbcCD nuclease subunit
MYGLGRGYDGNGELIMLNPNAGFDKPGVECVFFGIPEITKETYMAEHPGTPAEQANSDIIRLIDSLIDNEIAPMRAMFPGVPAIGLLHGNVSDASDRAFETDNILKRSDIVIKTDTLVRAGLTRWTLGHIHTPWESKKISAGYAGFAGIDRNPWGKTGYAPAMNLVEIDNGAPIISRIPYGTPRREKIYAPLESYEPDVAYWLEASSVEDQLPATGIHPWSRRTEAERTAVSLLSY